MPDPPQCVRGRAAETVVPGGAAGNGFGVGGGERAPPRIWLAALPGAAMTVVPGVVGLGGGEPELRVAPSCFLLAAGSAAAATVTVVPGGAGLGHGGGERAPQCAASLAAAGAAATVVTVLPGWVPGVTRH